MNGHLLTLVFLLVGAVSAQSTVYYITPLPDIPCPKDPCLTLSQFATNSSKDSGHISLILLPGNHTLNRELILSGADNFTMASQEIEMVMIECMSPNERYIINETTFATIKGVHFIGCGGNTVTSVKELVVEDTIFQGVEGEGRGTALVLNQVNFTKISECSFISNTPGVNSEHHRVGEFIRDPFIFFFVLGLKEDDLVSVGGALLTTSSNVSVTKTKFVHNEAEIGGVLLAYKSIISISQCTHSYNRALYCGGVMATVESSVNIDNSIFSNNVATRKNYSLGGVIAAVNGSFDITSSSFTNNSAAKGGGVMYTFGASFDITSNTFTNDSAAYGGVMIASYGSFNITNSTFNNNSAAQRGGVMITSGGSFDITSSTFNNNCAAQHGGVMVTSDGSFDITDCTFTNNSAPMQGGVMWIKGGSFTITSSTFTNSTIRGQGGVMWTEHGSFTITNSTFSRSAAGDGGVMSTEFGLFNINNSSFTNNSVTQFGGVIYSTFYGSFIITDSTFTSNAAPQGGVMWTKGGSFNITSSTFTNNSAAPWGGVMYTRYGSFNITDCTFTNSVAQKGGVMFPHYGLFTITSSTFTNNSAGEGSIMYSIYSHSSFNITNSTFTNNSVSAYGGVMYTAYGSFNITDSTFTNCVAQKGGVMYTKYGVFKITSSTFTNNSAGEGGVMHSTHVNSDNPSSFNITNSTFTNNSAGAGGVIETYNAGPFDITSSTFTNNSAARCGGVISTYGVSFNISHSTFNNNSATQGGIIYTTAGSFTIISSSFTTNKANVGGVIWSQGILSLITINNSSFNNNSADSYGITYTLQCSIHITDSTFHYNSGSLYTFSGNLTFSGKSKFENCFEPSNKTSLTLQEGGALTSYQSTIIFNGETSLLNNQARQGGAILAIESTIMLYGTTTIANNTATDSSGGGVSLEQSNLDIRGSCSMSNNYAMRGGGVHAKSSIITVHRKGTLQFTNNRAENGSGFYLEVNPKLYILKDDYSSRNILIFTGNHGNYGGAVYVADDTNSGACSPNIECFIQTFALYQDPDPSINTVNIQFSGNTATEHGPNLFGGLLDRCVPSPFAEVYQKQPNLTTQYYTGVNYLKNLSNIAIDSIASPPVRVCFCDNESEPDCSYQPSPIKVKKGETFKVSLVAVDQVNHSVEANIISSLAHGGSFSEGQQTQSVGKNCTDLTFNVYSQRDNEVINLYADGPCGSSQLSIRKLDIQFLKCKCPIGFQSNSESTTCVCTCDPKLSPYITNCNIETSSIIRENTNSWITYINRTDPPGYVIHPNCPFDYCQPQTDKVSINLNLPNGADAQCAFNHTGTLCGACQEHLSLSLGSSRCLPCPSHWPAVFVVILLAAIIAGVLLVTALLALNMTVAVGLINGFIFYANIMSANSAVFFPSSEPSFPTVFVAWLNLDLGIDVCFFDGLDTYIKTWLQLAFPLYIISLVVIIIIVSEYSPRFAALIGRKDPIATLATLILLSYAKLLSITITALSFTDISYPDGTQETVWLPDGNVKYFQGKHAALVIVALLIILVGVPYTTLLLLWQWIVGAPTWKVFKWTRSTKLNAFITVYHVPYNSKYRYWTGLLLLVRVILYITASVTVSANPEVSPLTTIILVGGLSLFKGSFGVKMFKKSITDIVETVVYFNLLALAAFSLYDFKADLKKQTAVAYTSTIITLLLLVGVIAYHVYPLIRKITLELNKHTPATSATTSVAKNVTYSIIEFPKPQSDGMPSEFDSDEEELILDGEDCRLINPQYHDQ